MIDSFPLPAFVWTDYSRFVSVAPVVLGWLVLWGRYRELGRHRELAGNRTYRDLAGVRRRVAVSVFELTRDPALVAEALVPSDARCFRPFHQPRCPRPPRAPRPAVAVFHASRLRVPRATITFSGDMERQRTECTSSLWVPERLAACSVPSSRSVANSSRFSVEIRRTCERLRTRGCN